MDIHRVGFAVCDWRPTIGASLARARWGASSPLREKYDMIRRDREAIEVERTRELGPLCRLNRMFGIPVAAQCCLLSEAVLAREKENMPGAPVAG